MPRKSNKQLEKEFDQAVLRYREELRRKHRIACEKSAILLTEAMTTDGSKLQAAFFWAGQADGLRIAMQESWNI